MQNEKKFDILINNVINKNLCCGCGTCVGICPTNAITFKDNIYYPMWLDENKCTNCGFCHETCPGKGFNIDALTKEMKEPSQKYNVDIGNYHDFKVGYSTNKQIRSESASGGIATALLLHALDKKIIDKVIIVKNDPHEICKPVYKITNSKEDIIESLQSKYIQVPLNESINDILKTDEKYGIVGLPCHIEGISLAQSINKKLSEQIIFKLGLFCGYSYSYECLDTLINRMNLEKSDISEFLGWRYGDNYPGFFSFRLKTGQKSCLSFVNEHNIDVANYALFRCFMCIDGLCQLSDISLGDTTYADDNSTFIISRTKTGEELLKSARKYHAIDYYTLNDAEALETGIVPFMLLEKRHKVLSVIRYLQEKKVPVPLWDIKESKISRIDKINAILRINLVIIVRKKFIRNILKSNPKLMEKIGGYIYTINLDFKHIAYNRLVNFIYNKPKLFRFIKKIYLRDFSIQRFFEKIKKRTSNKYNDNIPKLNVALVGVGGWGRQYADILHKSDLFNLEICFDSNKTVLDEVCLYYDISKANSLDEILAIEKIKAVFIVTPNYLHYEQCLDTIKAGKHVFIEKPVVNTLKEAENLLKSLKNDAIIISVGHNVRKNPEIRKMKEIIDSGEIGKVIMIESNNSQPTMQHITNWRLNKYKCPNGPLLQLGIHHIDTLRYLFGEIKEVKAYSKDCCEGGNADIFTTIFLFDSDIIGYLGTNFISEPTFYIKVYGTEGKLILNNNKLYLERKSNKNLIKVKKINSIKDQLEEFSQCIINNEKPEIGLEEAIKNLYVVEAIAKSAESQKTVNL